MATKTARLELRADPESSGRIAAAAEVEHLSVSAFTLRSALKEADRVLGRADTTLMSAALFDQLMASLDVADAVPDILARAAKEKRYN